MKVAVLGAGAIGLPLGYMLKNNDRNEVVYLVRGKKVATMESKIYKLFSYDKKKIITYENVKCLATEPLLEEFKEDGENPYSDIDVLFTTLPSDILSSDAGKALFKGLGKRLKLHSVIVCLAPGFRMQEKVFEPAGIVSKRVCYGLPNFLSHEVDKSHELANDKFPNVKDADFAFHYLMNSKTMLLMGRKPRLFKKSLSAAGKRSIGLGTNTLELSAALFLIINLLLGLQDFPKSLNKKDPSFKVGVNAFAQISKHYGGMGTVMRWSMGKNMFKMVDKSNRNQSKPLTVDFLRYHHGHKVFEQNVEIIEAYIEPGKQKGFKTDQIEEFIKLCRDFAEAEKKTTSPEVSGK